MHYEYAVEQVVYQWESGNTNDIYNLAEITEDQILDLAEKKAIELKNETITSIIENMREAETNKYKRVTLKQKRAVASFLLGAFGSIPQVIANAFDKNVSELFGCIEISDDELAVTQGHVVTLALGVSWKKEGDIFPASKKLSAQIEANDGIVPTHAISAIVGDRTLWIAFDEFKAFELVEADVKTSIY